VFRGERKKKRGREEEKRKGEKIPPGEVQSSACLVPIEKVVPVLERGEGGEVQNAVADVQMPLLTMVVRVEAHGL